MASYAQPTISTSATVAPPPNTENIYTIRQQFLYNVLHNPTDEQVKKLSKQAHRGTSGTGWQPVGPMKVPANFNGIGRVNCIVIDPLDTNTLYIGAACGGVFISHDGGTTWTSNSDNFPSLSIADIAVNPNHTDTLYAATGDGYGYEDGPYSIFWGGLYSAGVMKSTDGGNTWNTTGLSYLQSNKDIIQKLLIYPRNPNILLAATRNGIWRTTDAGATWSSVDGGHVYSMAFRPFSPDTVYAVNNSDLRVSYNAGATWHTLKAGINPSSDRATIAVSPATPDAVWVLDASNTLNVSHNGGQTFSNTASPADTAHFYGYYDRVLTVSPTDSNIIFAFGMTMARSIDAGASWRTLNPTGNVHVDNHAVAINPLHSATIYTGNDGGICVSQDGGVTWKNLGNGLMISQIYRMSSSQQSPYMMLFGLQDNGSFRYNGSVWLEKTGGDGMACAIHPLNDHVQVSSSQYGNFSISINQGLTFSRMHVTTQSGSWTTPIVFDPTNEMNLFAAYKDVFASYDMGGSFVNLTIDSPFHDGAVALAIAPSNNNVLYAADFSHILRTTDGGLTWTNVTGTLPSATCAITHISVDYNDPMHVYVTTSGYDPANKVFSSATGGTTWTNLSSGLPNIPADCIAIDSSTPGAIFVGTDIGVYYTDSLHPGWAIYSTGLPNVIANDLETNYANHKVRVATYGRGVWENDLLTPPPPPPPSGIANITGSKPGVQVFPNPTNNNWKIVFEKQKPGNFIVTVTDIAGRTAFTQQNADLIDASHLANGVYNVEVTVGDIHYTVKAVKE